MTEDVFRGNLEIGGDLLAEIASDGSFNGDFHPPLLRHRIGYPTSETSLSADEISCADLDVVRSDGETHSLRLEHRPSGRTVFPVDLGFLAAMRRPPLFQLLSRFAPNGPEWFDLPESLDDQLAVSLRQESASQSSSAPAEVITYRPRIVYDGTIVLARRRWTIPSSLFPLREKSESSERYFLRVNRWRDSVGLPRHIYARVVRRAPQTELKANDKATEVDDRGEFGARADADDPAQTPLRKYTDRPSRDLMKPQFIDFGNSLLVSLFGRLPGLVSNYVVLIEERYPDRDGLLHSKGGSFATESLLQISWKENALHVVNSEPA